MDSSTSCRISMPIALLLRAVCSCIVDVHRQKLQSTPKSRESVVGRRSFSVFSWGHKDRVACQILFLVILLEVLVPRFGPRTDKRPENSTKMMRQLRISEMLLFARTSIVDVSQDEGNTGAVLILIWPIPPSLRG